MQAASHADRDETPATAEYNTPSPGRFAAARNGARLNARGAGLPIYGARQLLMRKPPDFSSGSSSRIPWAWPSWSISPNERNP